MGFGDSVVAVLGTERSKDGNQRVEVVGTGDGGGQGRDDDLFVSDEVGGGEMSAETFVDGEEFFEEDLAEPGGVGGGLVEGCFDEIDLLGGEFWFHESNSRPWA